MAATVTPSPGRKVDKLVRDALLAAARQDPGQMKRIAEKVMAKAEEGDMQAISFIADRIDGKAVQPIVGDDDHPAILTNLTVEFVKPK